jgi:DNA-binding transcriptional LysR family regulator
VADRRLQVFHAVAKQLSFTKAAELLYMTQPAVTFQIKQLEEHYDTRLFDRGHGYIALTPAGECVLQYAEKILNLASEVDVRVSEITGEIGGALSIGASMTIAEFMLPGLLGEFKRAYPNVRLRLIVANSESIGARVMERAIDVGFTVAPSHQADVLTEDCCADEMMVICAPQCPLARKTEIMPGELLDHPFVSREAGSGTRDVIEAYLRKSGVQPENLQLMMELGSPTALNGVLETSKGFTIASRSSAARALRLGDLVAIPLKPRLTRPLSIMYPKEQFRSRLVTAFVDFASARIKKTSANHALPAEALETAQRSAANAAPGGG